MLEVFISPKIIQALGFNDDERAVFDVLIKNIKNIFGRHVSKIASDAGVHPKTAGRILKDFEKGGASREETRPGYS